MLVVLVLGVMRFIPSGGGGGCGTGIFWAPMSCEAPLVRQWAHGAENEPWRHLCCPPSSESVLCGFLGRKEEGCPSALTLNQEGRKNANCLWKLP